MSQRSCVLTFPRATVATPVVAQLIPEPEVEVQKDDALCVSCGACVGHCSFEALSLDRESFRVSFDVANCRACELCIPACSFGAISITIPTGKEAPNAVPTEL